MPYDHTQLEANVRGLIPNITANQLSNGKIDQYGAYAIRRLTRDKPQEITYVLSGNGGKYYDLPTILGANWIVGLSAVKKVYRPTENQISTSRDIVLLYQKEYQLFPDAASHNQLYLVDSMMPAQTVNIVYQTPYQVDGIDDATTTTLPLWMAAAVDFLTAALACYALSAQAAGTTSSSIPGDIVSWSSKQQEYRRAGQAYEEQYAKEIGLNQPVTAGSVTADFDPLMQVGTSYTTHFRR